VNVSDQFLEVRVLVANYRLIPVLDEMSVPVVPPVKGNRVAREKSPHECGQTRPAAPEEKVHMIRKQRPAIDACPRECCGVPEAHHESLTVLVITNNETPLYPTSDYMMEGSGRV
jgi:hypothetical protein